MAFLNSLSDTEIFEEAVCAAVLADVIVVSVYAADELPPDLYVWCEAWLPRRPTHVSALTALIGIAESVDSQSVCTMLYLQAVARRGQLDFIPQERKRPIVCNDFRIRQRASTRMQALQKLYGPHYDAYYHWELKER